MVVLCLRRCPTTSAVAPWLQALRNAGQRASSLGTSAHHFSSSLVS
jgi:hypothetical protein